MTSPLLRMEKTDLENAPDSPAPEGYVLRRFERGDEAGLARVYLASDLGCTQAEAVRERIVERDLFRPERLIVLERDGVVVGSAIAWEDVVEPPAGYLHMVGVLPEARGKGLGTLLAVEAIRQSRSEGFRVLRCHTDDFRLGAIRAGLRLGFRPVLSHASDKARWTAIAATLGVKDILAGARSTL
jgi:mycothiol synthase